MGGGERGAGRVRWRLQEPPQSTAPMELDMCAQHLLLYVCVS